MPALDDALAAEGAQELGELDHALGRAGHRLGDGVEQDAQEGEALLGPLDLVRVDDEAELRDDGLRQRQVALQGLARARDEEEVIEYTKY